MNRKNYITLTLLIMLSQAIAVEVICAQSNPSSTQKMFLSEKTNDFTSIYEDGYDYFNYLGKDILNHWQGYAAGVGGFTILTLADKQIQNSVTPYRSNKFLNTFNDFGRVEYLLIGSGAIYFSGFITDENKVRGLGLSLVKGLIYSGVTVMLLKTFTGRERPFVEESISDYDPLSLDNNHHSFPSGHTASVFTAATVLSKYFDDTLLSIGLYSAATVTAFARIKKNQHWFSDVLLGSMIGISSGSFVSKNFNSHSNNILPENLQIIPSFNSLNVVFSF